MNLADDIESEIDAAIDDVYERFLYDIETKYGIEIWIKYIWDFEDE